MFIFIVLLFFLLLSCFSPLFLSLVLCVILFPSFSFFFLLRLVRFRDVYLFAKFIFFFTVRHLFCSRCYYCCYMYVIITWLCSVYQCSLFSLHSLFILFFPYIFWSISVLSIVIITVITINCWLVEGWVKHCSGS